MKTTHTKTYRTSTKSKKKTDESLRNAVVVITGASSGIGKATALEFSDLGASVVVAARRPDALDEVVVECEKRGGHAIAVPTDVSDESAVKNLAKQAIRRFGRIDIWINNAGVNAAGQFEALPSEVFRRIVDVNLFGTVNGARAVLPYFREQGGGLLINISSQLGKMGAPYFSPYSVSKFGIRSLGECLREELMDTDIDVCTVMPATIDTPFFQHTGTYAGRPTKAIPPVYNAREVVDTIVDLARNPKREVFVGNSARVMDAAHTMMPGAYEKYTAKKIDRDHFEKKSAPDNPGIIFEPTEKDTSIDGGWQRRERIRQVRNAVFVLGGVALAWFAVRNFRKGAVSARSTRIRTSADPGPFILHRDPEKEIPDPKQVQRDIKRWERIYAKEKKGPAA